MASRILLSMDDLETAVRVNAGLEAAGYATTMVSTLDDARSAMRRANPDLVLLTGAVYEAPARHLAQLAHDAEISTLALPQVGSSRLSRPLPWRAAISAAVQTPETTAKVTIPARLIHELRSEGNSRSTVGCPLAKPKE